MYAWALKLDRYKTWSEMLASDKHSGLLGPFVSYEENAVCEYGPCLDPLYPRFLVSLG